MGKTHLDRNGIIPSHFALRNDREFILNKINLTTDKIKDTVHTVKLAYFWLHYDSGSIKNLGCQIETFYLTTLFCVKDFLDVRLLRFWKP